MAGRKWTDAEKQAQRDRALVRQAKREPDALDGPPVATLERPSPEARVARAIARRGTGKLLTPIEQIRPYNVNSVPDKSAGAYYLRPDGATIADVLIWYPNGAQHDREYDPNGKYSENAAYYQERQKRKGFEYVGPMLTVTGARRLVEILASNRDAEIERLEDEIALTTYTIENADRPEVRDQQRKRRGQFQARLERVLTPFDPDALVAQLTEIANAQEMANVPPQIMRVMRRMLGQMNDDLIARFQRSRRTGEEDPAMNIGADSLD